MHLPIFTVSLDFELHWGRFDKANIAGNEEYYIQARRAIPEILKLFKEFEIEATWATVGMLFAENLKEWTKYSPLEKPSYSCTQFSAYSWLKNNPVQGEFIFAPDLIQKILNVKGQEIGSHTFSHYYTFADGQTRNQYRQDLQAACRIAKEKFGIQLSSLVFPRNQINREYLDISKEEGFNAIRSNPADWYWQDTFWETLVKKIFRTGDAIAPLGQKSYYSLSALQGKENLPLMLPASRFLRPYHPNFPLLNYLKLRRLKTEMTKAAQEGEIYHLWWHPHNHGRNLVESLKELKDLLHHFNQLRDRYGMISKNMRSIEKMVGSVKGA